MMKYLLDLVYEPLLMLFGLFYLPHLILRLKQAENWKRLLRERFGKLPEFFPGKEVLWVHAVSVGEVIAVREFVRLSRIIYPNLQIAFSTTTPTGQAIAKKMEGDHVRVFYFPLDFSWVVKRVFQVVHPKCIIMMETEIWPNLIRHASKLKIPIGIMNGRISDRAFHRYQMLREWFPSLLGKLSFCFTVSAEDEKRFVEIGVSKVRTHVTGNMKFDIEASRNPIEIETLRTKWQFNGSPVMVCGSTHEGEEILLFRVFQRLKREFPALKLVIAPRHPERSKKVSDLARAAGFSTLFASARVQEAPVVLILDVVGELSKYYGLADVVFMGGSLIPHGGQNPIEPAQERKVILHGPHVFNFRDLYQRLDESGGALLVQDELALFGQASKILRDRNRMHTMGSRAFEVVEGLKGTTHRNLMLLEPWLKSILA